MANGGTFPYYDAKEFDCRIIGLPYKHNLTTMYIIVPNNSNRSRLRQMQQYLTADKIEDMISKMEWKTAIILLPRMHISNEINLKKVLLNMGVHSIFDRTNSDLSLISQGHDAGFAAAAAAAAVPYVPNFPSLDTNFKYQSSSLTDDDTDTPFLFSRHGEDDDEEVTEEKETTTAGGDETFTTGKVEVVKKTSERRKRNVSYKVPSNKKESPLRLKDYLVSKRIVKPNPGKKHIRSRRQVAADTASESLKSLDQIRQQQQQGYAAANPGLFAEEIIHKIDLTVNEKGTEGGAATVTFLYRTGTDAVVRVETPFIFMIRHDDTKLPLFYGTVYEPTDY